MSLAAASCQVLGKWVLNRMTMSWGRVLDFAQVIWSSHSGAKSIWNNFHIMNYSPRQSGQSKAEHVNSMQIEGRLLPAPPLQYAVEVPPPQGGAWNLRNIKFHKGAGFTSYGICSFEREQRVGRHGDPGSLMVHPSHARFARVFVFTLEKWKFSCWSQIQMTKLGWNICEECFVSVQ